MHRQDNRPQVLFSCKYCKVPSTSKHFLCSGPCEKHLHYTCTAQIYRYHNRMMTNSTNSNFYCVSCSIDRVDLNLSQINFCSSDESSKLLLPSKIPKPSRASKSTRFTSPAKKSPDVKNQIDTPGPSGNSNMSPPIRPNVYSCKYFKYCNKNSDSHLYSCKGPCKKPFHYGCLLKAYHNHMVDNCEKYCLSCSIDILIDNQSSSDQCSPKSPRFLKSSNISTPSIPIRTTRFNSPIKLIISPSVRYHEKFQINIPHPSKNSKINILKTDASTCSTPPTKKSPDVKNQINTPGPSGISNINPPEANISTCSTSPTKKSSDVKTLQLQTRSAQHDVEEKRFDFQEYITQIEQIHMQVEKYAKYLEEHLETQVKMFDETSVEFDLLNTLTEHISRAKQYLPTEMKEEIQSIENLQLDTQKTIQVLKFTYQLLNYICLQTLDKFSRISKLKKKILDLYTRNSEQRDKEDIEQFV